MTDDIKIDFWEEMDDVIHSLPQSEKLFFSEDFNGHIKAKV